MFLLAIQGATLLLLCLPPAARHVIDAAFDRQGHGKQLVSAHVLSLLLSFLLGGGGGGESKIMCALLPLDLSFLSNLNLLMEVITS